MIFVPDVLPAKYQFKFDIPYTEVNLQTADSININSLFFRSAQSKGVVFFLHGNAGALNLWGFLSSVYHEMNYDLFIIDYRGYGKSEGNISDEKQLYSDAQFAYDYLKKFYSEDKIIIIGQSIGTAIAAKLAADNHPKKLALISPYYSLEDLMVNKYRIIPPFLLKYKLPTYQFIQKVNAPIAIFHGNSDKLINYSASVRLKSLCKNGDQLFLFQGLGHNGLHDNYEFVIKMKEFINN